MSELKNCPFCGGDKLSIENCITLEDCANFERCEEDSYVTVVCDYSKGGCGASGGYRKTCEEAIAAWNRRAGHWMPVSEGLPESGKHILLCCEIKPSGNKYVCDGYYAEQNTISCSCDGDTNFTYSEEKDEFYLAEGFYEVIKNWDDYSSITIGDYVTHWMPLPEPPEGD